MVPRLVLVGGWEFTQNDGIDEEIAKFATGKTLLIPGASKFPDKQVERAQEKYQQYNTKVLLLNPKATTLPEGVCMVYFGGGQPEKLMAYFTTRPALFANIKNEWQQREIVWCGSSTGAMVVFPQMLAHGSRGEGGTELVPGVGLIKNNAFVIPHWDKYHNDQTWRERIKATHVDKLIITIDEHTAIFWGEHEARVVGLGVVTIVDRGQEGVVYKNSEIIKSLTMDK